jgi:hypothetical protein
LSGCNGNENLRLLIRAIAREIAAEVLAEHIEDYVHSLREADEVETELAGVE